MTSCETRPHLLLRANECSASGRRLARCPWQRAATAQVNKTHCNHQARFARFQHPGLANIAKLHPSATITCWNSFSGSRLSPSPIDTTEYLDSQKKSYISLIEKTREVVCESDSFSSQPDQKRLHLGLQLSPSGPPPVARFRHRGAQNLHQKRGRIGDA